MSSDMIKPFFGLFIVVFFMLFVASTFRKHPYPLTHLKAEKGMHVSNFPISVVCPSSTNLPILIIQPIH